MTYTVEFVLPGMGTSCDRDIFEAVGCYSHYSGCSFSGDRDHGWEGLNKAMADEFAYNLGVLSRNLNKRYGRNMDCQISVRAAE